jgi:ribosomal protein L11
LIYIDEYQTSRTSESTLNKFKSHSVRESEFKNASSTNDRSQNDSSVSDSSVRTSITNDSVRAFSVSDSSVKALITNDSIRASRSQKTFLQKSSQISSHVDTISRIKMSSSSLNERSRDSDINNETDDEEDNSIIVFRKDDDRNKNRFL